MRKNCAEVFCGNALFVDGICYRCKAREELPSLEITDPDAIAARAAALALIRLGNVVGRRLFWRRRAVLKLIQSELDQISRLVEIMVVLETSDRVCRCGLSTGDITTERHAAQHPELMTVSSLQW